jgi:hypothetical protein
VVDPLAFAYTHDDLPYAVVFMDKGPRSRCSTAACPRPRRCALLGAFPGQYVGALNFTRDGSEAVFRVTGDRNPGEFYLLDKTARPRT